MLEKGRVRLATELPGTPNQRFKKVSFPPYQITQNL